MNYSKMLLSKRWQGAIATILMLLANDLLGLGLSNEAAIEIVALVVAIIVGSSIRKTEPS